MVTIYLNGFVIIFNELYLYLIMANEVVDINGVTKTETNGNFVYFFPTATIKASIAVQAYSILQINDTASTINAKFADVTDKFGTTDVESYIDELARRRFFFDSERIVAIEQDTEDKQFAAGTGNVKTSFESTMMTESKSQTLLLRQILFNIQSIAE